MYVCMTNHLYMPVHTHTQIRYHALRKSAEEGIQNRSDSFAIAQDSWSEMAELGLDPTQVKQNSEKLVFLCYRGYNHIAGKLLGTTNKH